MSPVWPRDQEGYGPYAAYGSHPSFALRSPSPCFEFRGRLKRHHPQAAGAEPSTLPPYTRIESFIPSEVAKHSGIPPCTYLRDAVHTITEKDAPKKKVSVGSWPFAFTFLFASLSDLQFEFTFLGFQASFASNAPRSEGEVVGGLTRWLRPWGPPGVPGDGGGGVPVHGTSRGIADGQAGRESRFTKLPGYLSPFNPCYRSFGFLISGTAVWSWCWRVWGIG